MVQNTTSLITTCLYSHVPSRLSFDWPIPLLGDRINGNRIGLHFNHGRTPQGPLKEMHEIPVPGELRPEIDYVQACLKEG